MYIYIFFNFIYKIILLYYLWDCRRPFSLILTYVYIFNEANNLRYKHIINMYLKIYNRF